MLTPSSAPLWIKCSLAGNVIWNGGSRGDILPGLPQPESDARREGTCAHWVAEVVFTGFAQHPRELLGERHPNGWVVDAEMVHHVQAYIEYVRSFGPIAVAERPVMLFNLISGRLDTTTASGADIHIFDLKYGWKLVEAQRNYTALCYGLAEAKPGQNIHLHVFQPRPHHPDGIARVWTIPAAGVPMWQSWLYACASECVSAPRATPGAQCDECPAATTCHAARMVSYDVYEQIAETRMTHLDAKRLASELQFLEKAADLIHARKKSLEAEAEARIKGGEMVPGYGLTATLGKRVFTVEADRRRMITGRDPFKSVEKSPAEMEREGVPKTLIATITRRPTRPPQLTSNPEEYAKRMFGEPLT